MLSVVPSPLPLAIITGASSGIGLALAGVYFENGYAVFMAARDPERLKRAAESISADRKRVAYLAMDVSQETECKQLISAAMAQFGRIDVLINNAGITMRALFSQTEVSVLRQIMEINFWGSVYCTHYALSALLASKGSVVGLSSPAGIIGLPTRIGYVSSKFALEGFLKTLHLEYRSQGLHVMVSRPGFTATAIRGTMLDGAGNAQGKSHKEEHKSLSPERVARSIFNAQQRRVHIHHVGWQTQLISLLKQLFPGLLNKLVVRYVRNEKDSPFK